MAAEPSDGTTSSRGESCHQGAGYCCTWSYGAGCCSWSKRAPGLAEEAVGAWWGTWSGRLPHRGLGREASREAALGRRHGDARLHVRDDASPERVMCRNVQLLCVVGAALSRRRPGTEAVYRGAFDWHVAVAAVLVLKEPTASECHLVPSRQFVKSPLPSFFFSRCGSCSTRLLPDHVLCPHQLFYFEFVGTRSDSETDGC